MKLYKGKQRIVSQRHSGDVVVFSNINSTEDNEDVPNFASFSDNLQGNVSTGGAKPMKFAGLANRFQGTNAGLMGAREGNVTARGKNADTHRTRRKLVTID